MSSKEPYKKPSGTSKTDRTVLAGFFQVLAGCVLFILMGAAGLWSIFASSPGTLPLVLFLVGAAGCALFISLAVRNFITASRFSKIALAMGDRSYVKLSELESKLNINRKKLKNSLRLQMARGFWQDAYLDSAGGAFMLGYEASALPADSGDNAVEELVKTVNGLIHEMKTIGLSVEDTELKARVERMTEVTGKIYSHISDNPTKIGRIRQYSNYLLPATVGLLKNYQDLQNLAVKGENINESMEKIRGVMETIEDAFEKQFDDLFFDESLGIDVEVEVMQNLLESQGM